MRGLTRCKSTQRYKERKQFTTTWMIRFLAMLAVNQPKGTKNESNSQLSRISLLNLRCCKSTQRYKERKQFTTVRFCRLLQKCCKSTQRYKERKQFTTWTLSILALSGCKSTQRYKERKQFTTEVHKNEANACCKSTQRYKERKQFTTVDEHTYFGEVL